MPNSSVQWWCVRTPCGRRQAIIWTNVGILLIGHLRTNFSEMLIEICIFSFKKMHLKMSSGKRRLFCIGLNVLSSAIYFLQPQSHVLLWPYGSRVSRDIQAKIFHSGPNWPFNKVTFLIPYCTHSFSVVKMWCRICEFEYINGEWYGYNRNSKRYRRPLYQQRLAKPASGLGHG